MDFIFRYYSSKNIDRKRQTTARSFKITKGWASEGSTQAFAASLSQVNVMNVYLLG